MSIYGTELALCEEEAPGEQLPRAYLGSHIYPHRDHPAAWLDTGAIPHWCIPGHDGEGPGFECTACDADVDGYASGLAPWLRFTVGTDQYGTDHTTVVLPAAAVVALRDHLTDWLSRWTPEEET